MNTSPAWALHGPPSQRSHFLAVVITTFLALFLAGQAVLAAAPTSLKNAGGKILNAAPVAPTVLDVTATQGSYTDKIRVSWTALTGRTYYYRVYRATSYYGSRAVVCDWQASIASFTDTTVSSGQTYYYWVRAAKDDTGRDAGAYSEGVLGWRAFTAPADVAASDGTFTDKVQVTWSGSPGALYYRVFRADSPTGTPAALGVWQAGMTFNDTTAVPNVTYYYFVQAAIDNTGACASDYSLAESGWRALHVPTVTGITPAVGVNLAPLTNVTITGTGFEPGATVQLTLDGQAPIAATNVVVLSDTQISCNLDITGVTVGQWDVVVTTPDTQSGTLAQGFTVRNPIYQSDLLFRNNTDVDFLGDNIYLPGIDQQGAQSAVPDHSAMYDVVVENDGELNDAMTITATVSDPAWTVRIYDALTNGQEITADILNAGWSTASLAAGTSSPVLLVKVMPTAGVPFNSTCTVTLAATSQGDNSKSDTVTLVTRRSSLTGVTLATDLAAPQLLGTSITLTATPVGGENVNYQFRVGYQDATGWHWSVLRDYSANASCVWTPTEPRTYSLMVRVRDADTTNPYQAFTSVTYAILPGLSAVTLAITPDSPQALGATLNLAATRTGGSNVEYQFRAGYQDAAGWHWTIIREYASDRTCTWTPTEVRKYTVVVWAREVGSVKAYDVYAAQRYDIEQFLSVKLSVLPASPSTAPVTTGTSVFLSAAQTGGVNVEYQFRAGYQDATGWHWTIIQDYSPSAGCTWMPTEARVYTLAVWMREIGSTKPYQAYDSMTYRVVAAP